MDPYFDPIPLDHGEEIRKRMRERDGSDSQGRQMKRARANSSTLLPPESDEQEVEYLPEPPEDDLEKYDRERLQKDAPKGAGFVSARNDVRPVGWWVLDCRLSIECINIGS